MSPVTQRHNARIEEDDTFPRPIDIQRKYPLSQQGDQFISNAREQAEAIIRKNDQARLLAVVGPCSSHKVESTLQYLEFLKDLQVDVPNLLLVGRTYFEKPRTTVGWKGLIPDPHIDGSCDKDLGYHLAVKILTEAAHRGVPTATEFVNTLSPAIIADYVTLGVIGARSVENSDHRSLVSGLSMPAGFKNSTEGNIQVAIDAMKASEGRGSFDSMNRYGVTMTYKTKGNPDTFVILRGGNGNTNYDAESVGEAIKMMEKADLDARVMVDTSHANSHKQYLEQIGVGECVAVQVSEGNTNIVGVMIEGHIVSGKQNFIYERDDPKKLNALQSITDSCLGWDQTKDLLKRLDDAAGHRYEMLQKG